MLKTTCVVIIVIILPGLHLPLPAPATFFGGWSSIFVLNISHAILSMTQHGVLLSTQLIKVQTLYSQAPTFKAQTYPAGEGLTTLAAHKGGGHKGGVVVPLEVHIQKLLLSERFLTLAAGKWFLPRVCALVHYHVALLDTTKVRDSLPNATTFYIHPTFHTQHTCLQQ